MKKYQYIILLVFLLISCGKKSVYNEEATPMKISEGVDTFTVSTVSKKKEFDVTPQNPVKTTIPSRTRYNSKDNMRGFDPASEDDSDDNGMTRYMEVNDDEGWD